MIGGNSVQLSRHNAGSLLRYNIVLSDFESAPSSLMVRFFCILKFMLLEALLKHSHTKEAYHDKC